MGLFAQRTIQKKIAPVTVEVGPWVSQAREQLPFLSEAQVMFLAGLHVTASAQNILAGCTTSTLSEGRHHSAERLLGKGDSILRFEGFGSSGQLTLGTPGSVLDWKTDWVLQYSIGGPTSEITVPTYGTWNEEIANVERLDKIRALLADTIARGPQLVVTAARPDPAEYLTSIRCDSSFSPMARDYCDPPAATALKPIRIDCAHRVLLDAATTLGHATSTDPTTGETLIRLAPDGNPDLGVARLRVIDADHCELVFPQTAGLAPIEGQRVRRRSLRLTKALIVKLEKDVPGITTANDAIAAVARSSEDPTTWVEAWTDQTLSPQWMIKPGAVIPVAVVSTGHVTDSMLYRMIAGANSVALRRRTFTRGMTRKSRADARVVIARNAGILTGANGSFQPFLRYVSTPDVNEATIAVASDDLPMFWEVFHDDRVGDQGTTTLLLTTGLGTTDSTVVYGNELMAYLNAFCSFAANRDQTMTFQTIGLRVPDPA